MNSEVSTLEEIEFGDEGDEEGCVYLMEPVASQPTNTRKFKVGEISKNPEEWYNSKLPQGKADTLEIRAQKVEAKSRRTIEKVILDTAESL